MSHLDDTCTELDHIDGARAVLSRVGVAFEDIGQLARLESRLSEGEIGELNINMRADLQ